MHEYVLESVKDVRKIDDVKKIVAGVCESENVEDAKIDAIHLGDGTASITVGAAQSLFYTIVRETTGFDIDGDGKLMTLLSELSGVKKEYDKIAMALVEVNQKGYGIVCPSIDDLTLEEPEMVRQGSRFGVKLKASAPSIHMIKADIETEVSPIVGSEKQSEELVNYLLKEFEVDPKKIWESNIFGKSLHELVNEGLQNKLCRMPEEAQFKLQETLQRIINEGSGGLICIIL
jgi:stage IV sporulation protein A